jgi:dTDP-4-amino-4,6-dideoxygalactose transaminase
LHAPTAEAQQRLLAYLRENGIIGTFHYVPLHSSPAGQKFGRTVGNMANTDAFSSRLVRVPLWTGLTSADVDRILATLESFSV